MTKEKETQFKNWPNSRNNNPLENSLQERNYTIPSTFLIFQYTAGKKD
jgi:hypothetical protein